MILFAISFICIFISSYFLAAILEKKNPAIFTIYTFVIAFAQIVLTSEVLSLFKQIKEIPFLTFNIVFLIISYIIYKKKKIFKAEIDIKSFRNRFFNALNLDKSLWLLFIGWLVLFTSALILTIIVPISNSDALSYHVVRCIDWILNNSLNHFVTADERNISFPINSEILYMWIFLFTKKQLFLGTFSFVAYIMCIINIYNILKFFGYSLRKILWCIFILSSLASVIVNISGTETDTIIAALITSSMYLFIEGLKANSDNKKIYMSSLCYALAIGVKTTAIIFIPGVGIFLLYLCYKFKNKNALIKFLLFGILNFLIFSSYNYILNFLDYNNPMASQGSITSHKNWWGIKGLAANFIKHLFLFFDFSGFKWNLYLKDQLYFFADKILTFVHLDEIPNGIYSGELFNGRLIEPYMGYGILGFILVLQCLVISIIMPLFKRNKKIITLAIFGIIYIVNILTLSGLFAFMTYNVRFMESMIIISAPVLLYSYIKRNSNPAKIIYILFALYYMCLVSTHLAPRSFFKLADDIQQKGLVKVRENYLCKYGFKSKYITDDSCNIYAILNSKYEDKNYKILFAPNYAENIFQFKINKLKGYNYDFINIDTFDKITPEDYDIIIYPKFGQQITLTNDYNTFDYDAQKNNEITCYYTNIYRKMTVDKVKNDNYPYNKCCILNTRFYQNHPFTIAYQTKSYYIILNTKTFKTIR